MSTELGRGVNVSGSLPKDRADATKEGRTSPAPLLSTPCLGLHWLFDSVDPEDHQQARAICQTCPVIAACTQHLHRVQRESSAFGRPEGTWAGLGLNIANPSPQVVAAENARYSLWDARTAHAEYQRGMRTEWINTGERVYQRRDANKQRKAS